MRSLICILLLLLATTLAFAADKSGVSPNSISVPKGPGSLEGLGESFQPTLNTGTAKYSLSLRLPAGVAGHQPELALHYDGGDGNGPLGYGWTLPLPHLQRRTDKGIPTYGQNLGVARADTFINEMKEELVPRADGYYFCENEGAFIRYRQVGDHWEGTQPNGTKLQFGLTTAGRIEEPASARVFCWLLERETDTRGNTIQYTYRTFPGEENLNQKFLASIRYGPGAPPWTHFHFVTFEYEGRPDWFEDGRAGFLVRTGQRLKSIVIGTQGAELSSHLAGDFNGDGNPDFLNRRYDLDYARYAGSNSHWSLLEKVTLVGADGITSLPPAVFGYAISNPPDRISARDSVWDVINAPPMVMDNARVELIDLNADGLPDILKTEGAGGAHTVSLNRGPVRQNGHWALQWDAPVDVDPGPGTAWNLDLASDRTHLADMDGDGLADLVHKSADDSVFFFANRGRVAWGPRQEMTTEGVAPPAPFGDSQVRVADMDFDKRVDIIQSLNLGGSVAYRIWFNSATQGYSAPLTVEPEDGFDFTLPGVDLVDCNGDRIPDVVQIRSGAVQVAAGLGYGRFAKARSMLLPDLALDDEQIARAKLTDINGDGLSDLIIERAAPGECWFWLNQGNYTFTTRKALVDLPASVSSARGIRWADLDGNGTTDLIYADSLSTPRLMLIDLGELVSGGLVPNLLSRIENGLGRVTQIEYAPSTRFALDDEATGRPWPDALPFPVTVVSAVTVSDSLGHTYVTRFRYHDGYYEPVEKQFRGFAQVELIDVGDATAPTLVSRSSFDTGWAYDAMKGRLLRSSTVMEDGRAFQEEVTTWADPPRTLMVGTNGSRVRFAYPLAKTQQILELGQGTPRRLESEMSFDDYGNQTRLADFGIVEGGARNAFDDERITLTEYALNLDAWIVHLPRRQSVQDENGVVLSRSESFYDDETFSGNNPGRVSVGNLTLRREWTEPSNPMAFVLAMRAKYDVYGNPVLQLDPLGVAPGGAVDFSRGHARALAYDNGFHAFPLSETIQVGDGRPPLLYQAGFDQGFGIATRVSDFNTNTSLFGYDALARLTRVLKPDDTQEFPGTEYEYVLAQPAPYWDAGINRTGLVNYVETRQLDRAPGTAGNKREHYMISRQFVDGLGRALMTRSEAEPASGQTAPRVVVSSAMLFNARQKPARALNPFFTTRAGSLDELLSFENIEVPGWQGQFQLKDTLVALNLAGAHQSATTYDATLRLVRTINPDGTQQRIEYEPLLTRTLDENDSDPASPHANTPAVHFADGLGRLIRVDELVRLNDDGTPSGSLRSWTTRYAYDLSDRLTSIIDSQNNVKRMGYDGLKRKTFMSDPDGGSVTNVYDAASNLLETTDAKGQRTLYTYDGANRLATVDYLDDNSAEFSYHRSPDLRYHYDQAANPVTLNDGARLTPHNTRGALVCVEDTSGEEHTSYDARGRVEWTVKRIPDPLLQNASSPAPLVSYKTAFDYDPLDRVTRLLYPDNDQVTSQYNARHLLERVGGGTGPSIISSVDYAPSGQLTRLRYGNGVDTTYDYDERLRVDRLFTQHAAHQMELINSRYDFDGVSNIKAIHDLRSPAAVAAEDKRRNTQLFTYDDLYRLTRVQYNAPAAASANGGEINYRYDRLGNLLSQTSDIVHLENGLSVTDLGLLEYGGASGRFNRLGRQPNEPPGPHAMTSIRHSSLGTRNYSYDANGNVKELDGLRCQWDFENRLVAVEDSSMRAVYTYDYAGRRITKTVFSKLPAAVPDPVSATVYVGKHFEVRDHDQPTKYVFNEGTRIAHVTGSLSMNQRLQRFRLRTGWNLLSLAVTADNLAGQLQQNAPSQSSAVTKIYQWTEQTGKYASVGVGQTVAAGAVLWVKTTTNTICEVSGSYAAPVKRQLQPGGRYLAGTGLEAWSPAFPPTSAAWAFASGMGRWRTQLPGDLASVAELPRTFAPGTAFYLTTDEPIELVAPQAALRIRYYHPDHLGSATVMTDAEGALVEETAFYPFGVPRHEFRVHQLEEHYQFTQKERDRESGLHYFETRYLTAGLARFVSLDPKYLHPDLLTAEELTAALVQPQKLNLYAYALNNPLRYNDPNGLDETDKVGKASDVVGVYAGAAEEIDVWTRVLSNGGRTAAGLASKATMGVSVLIKAGQFAQDPSAATGGQLLNEGAKTLTSIAVAPVGLIWSVLDLSGYGPSAILESTEKSIQANRESTRLYKETARIYTESTRNINEKLPGIEAKMAATKRKLGELEAGTAKLKATHAKELEYLNKQIQSYERGNRRLRRELRTLQKEAAAAAKQ